MSTATGMDTAKQWALPAVSMLVAQTAALTTREQPVTCPDCGAGWVGHLDDPCDWCNRALQHQLDDQRERLLYPDWMIGQGPRYDELSETDRAVWDRTRGIQRGNATLEAWVARLVDAVNAGIVTQIEADAAISRAERCL